MTPSVFFWIVYIFWLAFALNGWWKNEARAYSGLAGFIAEAILFAGLIWNVFGKLIQGG